MADSKDNSKYWIKKDISVEHVNSPGIVMVVDQIKKEKRWIEVKGEWIEKTFVVGIECHWRDKEFKIQTAIFHTTELRPHLRLDVLTEPKQTHEQAN